VVLPWSTWAIIAMFLMFFASISKEYGTEVVLFQMIF
jgi:hypothetical protein